MVAPGPAMLLHVSVTFTEGFFVLFFPSWSVQGYIKVLLAVQCHLLSRHIWSCPEKDSLLQK